MALPRIGTNTVAESSGSARSVAPVDLDHLRRQSMDDAALAREVLKLFVAQAQSARAAIAAAAPQERQLLAHTLKGAARGIGAFAVASHAEALEQDPDDQARLQALDESIGEACRFVADIRI